MKAIFITILIIIGLLATSCNSKSVEPTLVNSNDWIEINKSQFELENMELGEPELKPSSESIHFTGKIIPSPKGIANISVTIAGVLQKINCNPGELIQKGQVLFEISGNEFIDMQRDFAGSAAALVRLKSEYERTKELLDENIGTQKELILAESSYKTELAKYAAINLKLEQIGLDVSKIENGNFYASYAVKSPINGYVANTYSSVGQYIEQQFILAEIIDINLLQLKFTIFENDINKLSAGQHIDFYLGGNKTISHNAKLTFIGKTINNNSKAIDCYAEIYNLAQENIVSNQFVEGEIIIGNDSMYSLPETAFVKLADEDYILNLENESDSSYFFSKISVKTGIKNNGYIELIDLQKINKVLVRGTYNIKID